LAPSNAGSAAEKNDRADAQHRADWLTGGPTLPEKTMERQSPETGMPGTMPIEGTEEPSVGRGEALIADAGNAFAA
jgi:hypothetical protein